MVNSLLPFTIHDLQLPILIDSVMKNKRLTEHTVKLVLILLLMFLVEKIVHDNAEATRPCDPPGPAAR